MNDSEWFSRRGPSVARGDHLYGAIDGPGRPSMEAMHTWSGGPSMTSKITTDSPGGGGQFWGDQTDVYSKSCTLYA